MFTGFFLFAIIDANICETIASSYTLSYVYLLVEWEVPNIMQLVSLALTDNLFVTVNRLLQTIKQGKAKHSPELSKTA